MKKLFVGLIVLFSLSVSAQQYQASDLTECNLTQDSLRFYMLKYINEFRVKNRRQPLQYDSALNVGAFNHSLYLACHDEFAHYATNRYSKYYTGWTPSDRCGMSAAENIAMNYCYADSLNGPLSANEKELAKELVEQWERSPGHRANMLDNHTKFGFGLSLRFKNISGSVSMYKVFAVQTFH
jgi:uncharacterized protein YkwD